MLVVHVHVHVLPDRVADFLEASRVNAAASIEEPGVVRFDVIQDQADETHVVLVEVYADADGAAAHKTTAHYAAWRDAVTDMMAKPRTSVRFSVVHPPERERWVS